MTQLVTRVGDDLVAAIDGLVAEGVVPNRSAAIRLAIEELVDRRRRQRVGDQIVEGYERRPQTDAEVGWADQATIDMIADEAW